MALLSFFRKEGGYDSLIWEITSGPLDNAFIYYFDKIHEESE